MSYCAYKLEHAFRYLFCFVIVCVHVSHSWTMEECVFHNFMDPIFWKVLSEKRDDGSVSLGPLDIGQESSFWWLGDGGDDEES